MSTVPAAVHQKLLGLLLLRIALRGLVPWALDVLQVQILEEHMVLVVFFAVSVAELVFVEPPSLLEVMLLELLLVVDGHMPLP